MNKKPAHIVFAMANNSSVPYFKWFADEAMKHPRLKFSFIALTNDRPQMLDEMKERWCDCYWIPFDSAKRKTSMLKAAWKMVLLFRKIKPDVVHTHLFDDSLPGLLAAKLAGVKVRVITKQDTGFHWNYTPQWVRFDRLNNKIATHIHTVATENSRFVIEKEKAPASKVHLIRNGFPFEVMTASNEDTITAIKNRYSLQDKFVVGTVARLIDWKGHKYILEAAAKLVSEHPQLRFIWAGSGDPGYKKELETLIQEKHLQDHIIFTGWLDRSWMPSFYKCIDVYLHPAVQEPFGFAITEALMNGIPVAATRTGSSDLITHKKDGFILREKSTEDITESILFYMNDRSEKMRIAEAGREHAQQHLLFSRMWNEHIAMYLDALGIKEPETYKQ